jgi:hypothetical protein
MNNNAHILREYTPTQCAYLAGIIDGEGSIYIGNFSKSKSTGTPYYQTNIEVTNTDEKLIDWLMTNIGGRKNIYTAKQTPKNSRRTVYRWIATGELVSHMCPRILPYLIIKVRQCEIMIEMRKTYDETGSRFVKGQRTFGTPSVPDHILSKRLELFNEIRSLHCRNYTCALSPLNKE